MNRTSGDGGKVPNFRYSSLRSKADSVREISCSRSSKIGPELRLQKVGIIFLKF